jgi:hypothetical protein
VSKGCVRCVVATDRRGGIVRRFTAEEVEDNALADTGLAAVLRVDMRMETGELSSAAATAVC